MFAMERCSRSAAVRKAAFRPGSIRKVKVADFAELIRAGPKHCRCTALYSISNVEATRESPGVTGDVRIAHDFRRICACKVDHRPSSLSGAEPFSSSVVSDLRRGQENAD